MFVANNVQNLRCLATGLNLNHINHLLDILKRKVRAQQLNLRKLTRVIHHMCEAIPQQYNYLWTHVINEYTVPCCRCVNRWMYKVLKQN